MLKNVNHCTPAVTRGNY